MVPLGVLVILYFLVLIPAIQTKIVGYFTDQLSKNLNTEIAVGRVYFKPFNRLELKDVLIKDHQNDTLVYMKSVSSNIDSIRIRQKKLYLADLEVMQPYVNVYKQDSALNFDFILKALKVDTVPKGYWRFGVNSINVIGGRCDYSPSADNKSKSILAKDVDVLLRDIKKDSIWSFSVVGLSLNEIRGLEIEGLTSKVQIGKDALVLKDFNLITYNTRLNIDSLNVHIDKKAEGIKKLSNFYLALNPSYISPHDVGLFVDLKKMGNLPFYLSGVVYGNYGNIKGRNVRFDFGEESSISTNFDVNGLPNVDETFLHLNVRDLTTTPKDLETIINYNTTTHFQMPHSLYNIDKIQYKGSFTGFLNDMVAFGEFKTSMGTINTDIGVKLDDKRGLLFAGNLSTSGFDIGKIVGVEDKMQNLSMQVTIQGNRTSSKRFYAYLDGKIDSVSINHYTYSNIDLSGLFANHKFDGSFNIDDPNCQLDFNGKIDFSTKVPNFKFNAQLENAKLDKLNLLTKVPDNELSFSVSTNFSGKDLNDIVGYIDIRDALFDSPEYKVEMDSLLLISIRERDQKHLILQSDLMEGDLIGVYNFNYIRQTLIKELTAYLPSVKSLMPSKEVEVYDNNFTFSCRFKEISNLIGLFVPDLTISDSGVLLGKINTQKNIIDLNGELEQIKYKNWLIEKPEVQISSGNDKMSLVTRCKEVALKENTLIENFSIHQMLSNDSVTFNSYWNNWSESNNSGSVHLKAHLKSVESKLFANVQIEPSYIMLRDSIWEIQATTLNYHPMGLSLRNFRMHHKNQEIGINGLLHKNADDGLLIHLQNIRIGDFLAYKEVKGLSVDGLLNGDVKLQDLYNTPKVSSDLKIKDFTFNENAVGDFYLKTDYLAEENKISVLSNIEKDGKEALAGGGYVDLASQEVALDYQLDSLQVGFLNLYLSNILQNLEGTASGKMSVYGPLLAPELTGGVKINKAFFDVGLLQTTYSVSDSIIFKPHLIDFRTMQVRDRYGRKGTFSGTIKHTMFTDMHYNLVLIANNMMVMDTKPKDNPLYYGTVFADGTMLITGLTSDINVDISGQTKANTKFYIPLRSDEVVSETNFIRFIKPVNTANENGEAQQLEDAEDLLGDLKGLTITMDLDITPDAVTQVIFDSKIGDILKGSGNGNLQIKMDKEGGINFFGDFRFVEGDYMFTLQNVINKRFIINQGSTISWDGDPYDAHIDLNATYKLRTSLYDLVKTTLTDESDLQEYNRRIPVNCNLLLTDRLMKPAIKFQIETPSAQKNNQEVIDAYINTEEELNRQVLALLVLNRFYANESGLDTQSGSGRNAGNNAALVTTTEVLSNQLSHWLSQISNDFDIGVSYRLGEEGITSDEIEVAMSTQVFNNRVTINGNVGYAEDNTRTSNLIGDFDVEIKLNKSGSLRAKAYTQTNNEIIYNDMMYNDSPTRQGVGVSFREEFDTLRELMHRYWKRISGGVKKVEEKENNE